MDELGKYEDQIDAYLNGKLQGDTLKEFEQLLNTNKDIQMEVRIKKELKESFALEDSFRLKVRLKEIQEQTLEPTPVVSLPQKSNSWLKYAAAIALLACVLFGVQQSGMLNPGDTTSQFASYYEVYPMDAAERGSTDTELKELTTFYNNKDYTAALERLNTLVDGDDQIQWKLYRGISLLETGDIQSAILDLRSVSSSSDENWKDHGRWYLALAYLKTKNTEAAKQELQVLAGSSSADHHTEAKELLEKL